MSDLRNYIDRRKKQDKVYAKNYDFCYSEFKLGEVIQQLREEQCVTQEELAKKIHTNKTAISRLENHSEDIRLSTLHKIVTALGRNVQIQIS